MALEGENIQKAEVIPAQNIETNTEGGLGAQIDQTTQLGGANPQGLTDAEVIAQANAQFAPTPAGQVTAIGDPGNASLYPTLNQPINVGTQSGSIIGSNPIFAAPGAVAPFGALMQQQAQRQLADQEKAVAADEAKKKKAAAFKFDRPKMPTLKDQGFQKSLDTEARNVINDAVSTAKQLHGADWQVALKEDTEIGRKFRADMDGLEILAKNADLMTDKFGEIESNLKSGEKYYTPGVMKAFRDYNNLAGDFEKGDYRQLGKVRETLRKIEGEMELNEFLHSKGVLSNIKGEITGRTGISDMGEFMKLKTSDKVSYDKNIAAIVQNVSKSLGPDSSFTPEDIQTALEGHLQNQSKSTASLTKKPKKTGRGINKDDINFSQGSKPIEVINEDGTVSLFNAKTSHPIPTAEKPLDGIGLQFVNKEGQNTLKPDVQSLNPVEAQVIEYRGKDNKLYSKRVVVATEDVEEEIVDAYGDKTTKTVTKTHLIDYDSNEDRFRTELGDDFNDVFKSIEVKQEPGKTGQQRTFDPQDVKGGSGGKKTEADTYGL